MYYKFGPNDIALEAWAEAGAAYGMLSALFTGLAFVGLIITIWQQKQQLKIQSEELEATRDILELQLVEHKLARQVYEEQRDEFKDQSETFKRQQFENAFFNFFNSVNLSRNSLEVKYNSRNYHAESCILLFNDSTVRSLKKSSNKSDFVRNFNNMQIPADYSSVSRFFDSIDILVEYVYENSYNRDMHSKVIKSITSRNTLEIIFLRILSGQYKEKHYQYCNLFSDLNLNQDLEEFKPHLESLIKGSEIKWESD